MPRNEESAESADAVRNVWTVSSARKMPPSGSAVHDDEGWFHRIPGAVDAPAHDGPIAHHEQIDTIDRVERGVGAAHRWPRLERDHHATGSPDLRVGWRRGAQ